MKLEGHGTLLLTWKDTRSCGLYVLALSLTAPGPTPCGNICACARASRAALPGMRTGLPPAASGSSGGGNSGTRQPLPAAPLRRSVCSRCPRCGNWPFTKFSGGPGRVAHGSRVGPALCPCPRREPVLRQHPGDGGLQALHLVETVLVFLHPHHRGGKAWEARSVRGGMERSCVPEEASRSKGGQKRPSEPRSQ